MNTVTPLLERFAELRRAQDGGRESEPFVFALGYLPGYGSMIRLWSDTNFAAGNAEFLDPDERRLIQVRPLLSSDVDSGGMGRPCNTILWARDDVRGWALAAYVKLPAHHRRNDRKGVDRAIRYVATKLDMDFALLLRGIATRSRWPSPTSLAKPKGLRP